MLDTIKVNGFNDFGQDVFEFYYNIQKLSDALTEFEARGFFPTEARFTK
jgi:hypothetical protein